MADSGQGRILGLDAGERRIGVAISDPERRFALPLHSLERDRGAGEFAALEELVRREGIDEIVVGLPLSLSGGASAQTESAAGFAAELERRLGLKVHLWDERLSTHEAQRLVQDQPPGGGRRAKGRSQQADTDALAASIILQAFLDSRRLARAAGE